MSDQQQQRNVSAAFPAPPPFWKHFTPSNVAKLEEIKAASEYSEASSKKRWTPEKLRALEVPQELRYLIPPPPPVEGALELFGEQMNVRDLISSFLRNILTNLQNR